MKNLLFILMVLFSAASTAADCKSQVNELTKSIRAEADRNNREIKQLADQLVKQGKAKDSINLVYKLQFSDPDVAPINKKAQEEAVAFFKLAQANDCKQVLASLKTMGELENKRAAMMVKKLKQM